MSKPDDSLFDDLPEPNSQNKPVPGDDENPFNEFGSSEELADSENAVPSSEAFPELNLDFDDNVPNDDFASLFQDDSLVSDVESQDGELLPNFELDKDAVEDNEFASLEQEVFSVSETPITSNDVVEEPSALSEYDDLSSLDLDDPSKQSMDLNSESDLLEADVSADIAIITEEKTGKKGKKNKKMKEKMKKANCGWV